MRTTFRSIAPPSPPPSTGGPELLTTAAGIGERLVGEAIWYRGRCNWVAADASAADGVDRYRPVHRALGSALDHGTAGVALFLAQLHAATGDEAARRTALGALGQALAHGEREARGLYRGRIGIAYAAARCGRLLGEERLVQRAARLARGRPAVSADGDFSLVSGRAGAIVGLLALARLLDDDPLVQRAQRRGDELVAGLRRGRDGWFWPPPGEPRGHGLCGMAQGASGGARALLELHGVTGQARHRIAAERALDYEHRWFDTDAADWPDLRGVERHERRGTFAAPYPGTWAHGAPGIALARLRAWTILGDEHHRAAAATALATTAVSVERAQLLPGADFTLARGLAGRAEVLLLGAELAPPGSATLARRVGEIGASRHAGSLAGWPCGGDAGGLAPGLLAGHAGIGLFYLRLHDPGVPSPLLI